MNSLAKLMFLSRLRVGFSFLELQPKVRFHIWICGCGQHVSCVGYECVRLNIITLGCSGEEVLCCLKISSPSFFFVNRVGPYVGSKLRRQELVTLSVTLVDASVPVVTITHSFGLTVTSLPSLIGLCMCHAWLSADPFGHRPTTDSTASFSHIWGYPIYTCICGYMPAG